MESTLGAEQHREGTTKSRVVWQTRKADEERRLGSRLDGGLSKRWTSRHPQSRITRESPWIRRAFQRPENTGPTTTATCASFVSSVSKYSSMYMAYVTGFTKQEERRERREKGRPRQRQRRRSEICSQLCSPSVWNSTGRTDKENGGAMDP